MSRYALLAIIGLLCGVCATGSTVDLEGAVANHLSKYLDQEVKEFIMQHPDYNVSYEFMVSGPALELLDKRAVDFAITQNTAPNATDCSFNGLLPVPFLVGVGAVFHNVPGLTSPKLNACTLAGIFSGKITTWNDPAIVRLNPAAKTINKPIRVDIREDDGPVPLTRQLIEYIRAQCPSATQFASKSFTFPASFHRSKKIKEQVESINSTLYSIGYVQASSFPGGREVAVQNQQGEYITAATSNTASFIQSLQIPTNDLYCWGDVKTTNLPGKGVHPITYLVYFIAPQVGSAVAARQRAVAAFAAHLLSAPAQQNAELLGFKGVVGELAAASEANQKLMGDLDQSDGSSQGAVVAAARETGGSDSDSDSGLPTGAIAGIAVGAVLGALLLAAVGVLLYRRRSASRHQAIMSSFSQDPEAGAVPMPVVKSAEPTV